MKIQAELIRIYKGHQGPVYCLEHSGQAGRFFSGSGDRIVSEWKAEPEEDPKAIINVNAIVYTISYIPEFDRMLIGDSAGAIHLVDLERRQEVKFITHHKGGVFHILTSPVNRQIYTVSAEGELSVWSMDDLSLLRDFKLGSGKARKLALNFDESELAIACGDGHIRFLDTKGLNFTNAIPAHQQSVNSLAYHPEQNILLSGGRDAMLRIWDTKKEVMLHEVPAHNYAIYEIVFSGDNQYFATASRDKTIKIWDSSSAEFLLRIDKEKFNGHTHSVNTLLWSEHGNELFSAGDDRTIRHWKISSTEQ